MSTTRLCASIACFVLLFSANAQASSPAPSVRFEDVNDDARKSERLDTAPEATADTKWHDDGDRLRRRGRAMRAAGWTALGASGVFAATSTALAFRIKHCESANVSCRSHMFSDQNMHSYTRPRMAAGLTGSLSVVLATAVAVPNLVVGKRYQRLGDSVINGTYAPLEARDYWSARLAIGEQKQRSGRALRNTGLASFGVFGALTAAGFMLPQNTDISPAIAYSLKGAFDDSDRRVILLSAGLGGLIFIAAPLTIGGFSMEARGRNIVRREQRRAAPSFTLMPETYVDGAGGRMLVVF